MGKPSLFKNNVSIYSGVVQKGEARGKLLGYPTANIPFEGVGITGIYAARVMVATVQYNAAVFVNPQRHILEAHLLDFSGDLYGQKIWVELHKKIRESADFENDEALKEVIAKDVHTVRKYFTVV